MIVIIEIPRSIAAQNIFFSISLWTLWQDNKISALLDCIYTLAFPLKVVCFSTNFEKFQLTHVVVHSVALLLGLICTYFNKVPIPKGGNRNRPFLIGNGSLLWMQFFVLCLCMLWGGASLWLELHKYWKVLSKILKSCTNNLFSSFHILKLQKYLSWKV